VKQAVIKPKLRHGFDRKSDVDIFSTLFSDVLTGNIKFSLSNSTVDDTHTSWIDLDGLDGIKG